MFNEKLMDVDGRKDVLFKKIHYPGVESDNYLISEYGDLYNANLDKFQKGTITARGYIQHSIQGQKIKAHRLVAYEFVDKNRDLSLTVDHIDGNKLNNHYTNLEWVTAEENLRRAFNKGLMNISDLRFYSDELVHKVCEMYEEYNYAPIEVYRILNNDDNTPRGNKKNEAFYRFLVSLRKKEVRNDITKEYNYDPNEALDIKRMPGKNSVFSADQIKIIAKLYMDGKPVSVILKILNIDTNDHRFNRAYSTALRIIHRQSYTHLTDDIFISERKKEYKSGERFDENSVRIICKMLAKGVKAKDAVEKMGIRRTDPDFKRYYDGVVRIANGRQWASISKDYFDPHKLANRKTYNLNDDLIFEMVKHGYAMKEICSVYGMEKKMDDPNLYRCIMGKVSKFRKLNKTSEITSEELQKLIEADKDK